ncbi:sensor histidine kinase [Patescibacteria group bacterium]
MVRHNNRRLQNFLILLSLSIPFIISFASILLRQYYIHDFGSSEYSVNSIIIFIGITSYLIVRHKLFGIEIIIRKTFIYSFTLFLTLILLVIPALVLGQTMKELYSTNYIVTLSAIIITISIGFFLVYKFIEKYLSQFIFREIFTLKKVLYSISDIVKQNNSTYDIAQKSIDLLVKRLKLVGGVYYSWSQDERQFIEEYAQSIPNINIITLKDQTRLVKAVLKSDSAPFHLHKIPRALSKNTQINELANNLPKNQTLLFIPVQKQEKLVGLYIFTVNKQELPTRNEMKLFEAFASQSAAALENAQLQTEKRNFKQLLTQATKSATKKADEARSKLEAVLETRSQFFVDVAHELRTPLTILQGNVDLAFKNSNLEEAETIQRELTRMNKLTSELIELSRIESGDVPLEKVKINLAHLLEDILLEFDVLAKAKNINISLDVNPEITIAADQDLLEKVVSNLISNALRYSKRDTAVTIFGAQDKKFVSIEVVDQGVGIEPADLEKIWERFYRVDKQKSRVKGGTGLGLPIVKLITELHGGHVEAKSTIGKGSSFTLLFPRHSAETPK